MERERITPELKIEKGSEGSSQLMGWEDFHIWACHNNAHWHQSACEALSLGLGELDTLKLIARNLLEDHEQIRREYLQFALESVGMENRIKP